ncbi:MAG: hypothetical protein ABL962_10150, partial [Fimbriimonadaceae bacterium]
SVVVLHVSRGFSNFALATSGLMRESANVLINPERFDTSSQGLLPVHLSNFSYAASKTGFSHFVLHSSNDMYIRSGLADHLKGFDAAVRPMSAAGWTHADTALKHEWLQGAISSLGMPFLASTPEGTCYRLDLMKQMAEYLQITNPYVRPVTPYPDEETILPTLASKWAAKSTKPITYSEVTMDAKPSPELIAEIRGGNYHAAPRTFYRGTDEQVPYDEVFAVKRIARVYDDPLRVFIRSLNP